MQAVVEVVEEEQAGVEGGELSFCLSSLLAELLSFGCNPIMIPLFLITHFTNGIQFELTD